MNTKFPCKTFVLFCLLFITTDIFAQGNFTVGNICGTMQALELLKLQDPGLESGMQKIENQLQQIIQNKYSSSPYAKITLPVITIPVVFHVVYNNGSENVPDSVLQAQLVTLNEDFRRLNADTSNTRAQFIDDAADIEVAFCLAVRDPNGDTTSGITRTPTAHGPFTSNDDVKFDAQGGKDAWPRDDYLNIWVCDLNLGGYAQLPGGPAESQMAL